MGGLVFLVRKGAPALADNGLALAEQMVADLDGLVEQPAGVAAQVEDQPLDVAEVVDGPEDILGRVFLELRDVNIAHAGTDFIGQIDRWMLDFVAHQVKDQRVGLAIAQHGCLNVSALGAFERLGYHIGRSQAVGVLAVHADQLAVYRIDNVAGMDAGAEGGRSLGGIDDVDLAVLLLDGHADAVVLAVLLLAHLGVCLGIKEVGVRIKDAQHPRNRPVVDCSVSLFAVDRLGVVLLHQRIDVGEGFEAVAQLAFVSRGLCSHLALQEAAHEGADGKKEDHGKEGAAGARRHRRANPPNCGAADAKTGLERQSQC